MYQKSQSYHSWDREWDRQNFLSFWAIFTFLTPPPLMIPKIKILEKKMKKIPGDIILLYIHICIYYKWRSYDVWSPSNPDMFWYCLCGMGALDHFLFLPFYPQTTQKIKIKKKTKKCMQIYHFAQMHQKELSHAYRGGCPT